MPVIGVEIDQLVRATIGVKQERAGKMCTGHHVPKVTVDGIAIEHFANVIPVVPPRVGRPGSQNFYCFARRMVTPNASFECQSTLVWRSWQTDSTGARTTASSVQPTIGTELQSIGKVVVVRIGNGEPIQYHFAIVVGHIVLIFVGNEDQFRWTHQPNAAFAHGNAGQHLNVVGKHRPLFEFVAMGVVKDQNAIAHVQPKSLFAFGIRVVFRDPQSAFAIPRHRDRVLHIRFGRKHTNLESFGNLKSLRRIGSRHQGVAWERLRIDRRWEIIRKRQLRDKTDSQTNKNAGESDRTHEVPLFKRRLIVWLSDP